MNTMKQEALRIVSNPALTHEQAVHNLAALACRQNGALVPPPRFAELLEEGLICDMGEGLLPYAPRYPLPDYARLMQNGCRFLRLPPPQNLREALRALEIFYRHVPSITHYPVYLGSVDALLEPYLDGEPEAAAMIEDFLFCLSRSIPDSYCHMNLGPAATRAGRYILEAEIKLNEAIPSITLLYDPAVTPDDFAELALRCALVCAKPSFANHPAYAARHPGGYGIASCYNALPVGGGSFTLSRLVLSRIAQKSSSLAEFLDKTLPEASEVLFAFMEQKIRFLVEESHFFHSSFLVEEGFLQLNRFTAMLGVVGLCECVNILLEKEGRPGLFGHSEEADALGCQVMQRVEELAGHFSSRYCEGSGHHFLLHAQVGIDSDIGISPGARVAIGQEPELYAHLRQAARFHPFFPSGVGDIFPFEATGQHNPAAILDIIKGAFSLGLQYFSTYTSNSDVVRITGYLVKRSDMEALANGRAVPQANTTWGLGAMRNNRALERQVRRL